MSTPVKSAVLASGMHLTLVAAAFIRNVIFARFLSPEDFSIAMTLGVVMLLAEHVTNLGHETLLLRSTKGNAHGFQATLHSSLIFRGIVLALGIILAAPYISMFFKLPSDTFNYGFLGIIPFIRGFTHLDYQRLQREYNFTPAAKMSLAADGLSIIVALICAYTIDSYWAFYISFVFRHSFSTVLSHVVATRAYQLRIHSKYLRELIFFSLPILLVGVTRYFGLEADKAIIARYSGLELFTSYALTIMLISNAVSFISLALAKIFIRRISRGKTPDEKTAAYRTNGIISLYLLLPILLSMCIFSEYLLTMIFGSVYQPIEHLVPVVCCLMLIRILNQWQNHIVISCFNTFILIIGSIIRMSGLAVAVWVATFSSDVKLFCASFLVGELIYFIFFSCYINRYFERFIQFSIAMTLTAFLGMALILSLYAFLEGYSLLIKIIFSSLALFAFVLVPLKLSTTCHKTMKQLFQYIMELASKFYHCYLVKKSHL